ncbi:transglutaminase family protein [Paraburkholderia sacchari]|uniref:transglutaminase family protein n=1 Tax=Paraburkholderia sacchari TaxID=159450 RepID=UPI0005439FD9|nr:transglutaminase family protein [Paraburkholderia sacchari]NLP63715.1 transglutaminase family protein [Paraburkholderia sacchari]
MRLAIRHISRFRFEDHVMHVLQRLRLRPQSGPGQTVRAWQVTIDGVEAGLSYADGLGNQINLVRHERATRPEIVIVAAGVVETQDRAGIVGPNDGYAPPWIFERETELTRAGERIRSLAAALPPEHRGLDALHWLMSEVHDRIAYAPGNAATAPEEAESVLGEGEGTSRDHAHVFIAAARALNIPARYICGYLLADGAAQRMVDAMQHAGGEQQEQSAGINVSLGTSATMLPAGRAQDDALDDARAVALALPPCGHAWAEAHVDGLGWVGFDPFMNRCPDERYVRAATGFDYRDTQPVTGPGTQTLGIEISVVQSPELV